MSEHIRWSDHTKEEQTRQQKIQQYYNIALQSIREHQITFLGSPVNLNNQKEVIALLYILYKDYESFHERL